ncbi:uncharacterized protein [Amphiura filiformis]|uniref:uncharacterized protein n=1 Tax=Amphiura filiformis TaxID=82378 RepID=UPI003B2176AA
MFSNLFSLPSSSSSSFSSRGITFCSHITLVNIMRHIYVICVLNSILAPFYLFHAEAASLRDFGLLSPRHRRQHRQPIHNICQLEQSSATQVHGILNWLRNKSHRLYITYKDEHELQTTTLLPLRPFCLDENNLNHGTETVTRLQELPQFGFWLWRMMEQENNTEIAADIQYLSELINSTSTRIQEAVTSRVEQCECYTPPVPYTSENCSIPSPPAAFSSEFYREGTRVLFEISRTLYNLNLHLARVGGLARVSGSAQVDGSDPTTSIC